LHKRAESRAARMTKGRSGNQPRMNYYLYELTYTSEAWQQLIKHPQNRAEAVRPVIQALGGDISVSWVTAGEYDLVAIIRLPDEVAAAAVLMAFKGGGALARARYMRLLSWDEAIQAMTKAGASEYRPPGGASESL
jgi:uncharacterized protein with GYD domain